MFGFKKITQEPWMYLGWAEINYATDGEIYSRKTIHFYGRGTDLQERKFEYEGQSKYDTWKGHLYIQQCVIPWMHGDNLWDPIKHPSDRFKEWTKDHCGFEWKGGWWQRPVKALTGNLTEFPSKR